MNNNFDLVVIYRRMEKKDVINYIPVYCEVGTYNQESEVFTTTKGKKYHHLRPVPKDQEHEGYSQSL